MLERLTQWRASLRRDRTALACARARQLLTLHVAGDLPTNATQAVARHLAACPSCRAEADAYAASRAWLQVGAQAVFEDEFYDDMRAAVLRQIARRQTPAPPQRAALFAPLVGRRPVYALASLALLALVAAATWFAFMQRANETPQPIAARATPPPVVAPTAPDAPPHVLTPPHDNVARETGGQRAQTGNGNDEASPHQRRARRSPIAPAGATASTPSRHVAQAGNTHAAPHDFLPPDLPNEFMPHEVEPPTAQPARVAARVEVARIEFQTADPNIRIIWLAPAPPDADATTTEPKR
jgi:hypothetical protein